jgi:UDP-glucose 4-epimerase
MTKTILATGGAGYIGSHIAVALLDAGYNVVILDNFANSAEDVVDRINNISSGTAELARGDVRDAGFLDAVFSKHEIDAVIHLAGLKAVGESVLRPLLYYGSNIAGAVSLLEAMDRHRVRRLVFSSTATVYGVPEVVPIPETSPTWTTSPYAETKLMIERIIDDAVSAESELSAISLRYFNPVGAHPSATLGENPVGVPNNLFPFIAQTAAGLRTEVSVFGDDYPTPDGTGVRDYIHVMDLAEGHVAALDFLLLEIGAGQNRKLNLGCGRGTSVLEALQAFQKAVGRPIPYRIVDRRPGDVPTLVADPTEAQRVFKWRAVRTLDDMCADHWAFQRQSQGLPA